MQIAFNHTSGKTFAAGTAKLYYEELPNAGKPAMLLLHGGMGSLMDFNGLVADLSKDYHLIGLDARGHGHSTTGTEKYTYQQLQEDAETLLQELGITTVALLGFSDGGIVAYRMAAASRVTVSKLITIGGTWSVDDIRDTFDSLTGFTVDRWKEVMPDGFQEYVDAHPGEDPAQNLERFKAMWVDETDTGYPGDTVKNITCPTLIIRGDEDHMFPRASAAKLADTIPDAQFYNLPFATHTAHLDKPEHVLEVIKEFLERNDK